MAFTADIDRPLTPVLLVEDDLQLAESLGDYLTEFGFEVDFAYNGQMAIELLSTNDYAAVIMDIAMPVMDGLAASRQIRKVLHDTTPIVFLTARDTLEDKLEGYRAGGDDYLVKPFAAQELLARLKAVLRRARGSSSSVQELGPLRLDHARAQAFRDEHRLDLHDIQFRLLAELARAAPDVVLRRELEARLWPGQVPGSDPLRTHVYRLRRQLDGLFDEPILVTVHGKGYRLAIPD